MTRLIYRATNPQASGRQAGFTIIELLIATLVFSLVLILITISVLTFTKAYFRGVNQSNTQNAARTIIENISQAIQFSGDAVNPTLTPAGDGSQGFCIGNQRYSFITGWQLMDGTVNTNLKQTKHALVMDAASNCSGLPAQPVQNGNPVGTELLSPRMRLTKMKVEPTSDTSVWRVTVRVVFGDNDLLCSPSVQGDCQSSNDTTSLDKPDLTCKVAFAGSEYCATSELSTVVKKRITAGQ